VNVNIEISARSKRLLLRVGLPAAILLGVGGIAYASLPHTFTSGEVLTAANLNNNFQSLDTRLTALEAREGETNGSRLVARYTTTTSTGVDGSAQVTRSFAGWFDTQRSEYCAVQLAGDGQQRCLPNDYGTATGGVVSAGSPIPFYSDSACTKPVIIVYAGSCQAAPKYFSTYDTGCPVGARHLFPVGAQLTLSTLYDGSHSQCMAAGAPGAGTTVYDASATVEVAPSTFVAFTVTSQTQ
jgi:hypothetical protein